MGNFMKVSACSTIEEDVRSVMSRMSSGMVDELGEFKEVNE